MSSKFGYPEEEKKSKELILGKIVDEIRKVIKGRIREKVLIQKGDYRQYKPITNSNWDHPSKNKTELGEGLLTETDIPTFLFSFGFKRTGFDNGVMFFKHSKGLDAWHDFKSMNIMVGKGGRNNKVFKGNQEKELSKYLQKKFRLKSSEPQWMYEAKARDYKAEYKKFQSSTKSKKYRAELNKYNRQKGTYGNGDKKDASHKGGKIVGFEAESKNRGRAEKSRLKKEEKLNEFNKAHFLNLIKKELDSKKGQLAYAEDKVRYEGTPKWERKEWLRVATDLKKEIKILAIRVKQVMKMKEGKLTESQVAKIILQQLGGNKFIAMTGAKNLGASGKSLSMKIGRNSKSISHVVITLKSSDLYDMEFIRMRGASRKVVKKVTVVYNDMLGKIFTKYTGLRVRL